MVDEILPTNEEGPVFRNPPVYNVSEVSGILAEMVDWGIVSAKLPERWAITRGRGVRVCVLDTGIDLAHPDLLIKEAQDFTGGRNPSDKQKHGTHTAGTINAQHNDMLARGGAPEAELYVAKVLDDWGNGLEAWIAAGIDWATALKADVISMSFGSISRSAMILAALERYVQTGGIPIAAAGNDGTDHSNWPAAAEFVISVGAVDPWGRRARFSSWGDEVDIAAPGTDIVSTAPGGGLLKMSGTSMATPLVAAVACLAKSYHKLQGDKAKTKFGNVYEALANFKAAAQKFPDPDTKRFGAGLIDANAMLALDDPIPDVPAIPPVVGSPLDPIEFQLGDTIVRSPSKGTGFLEFEKVKAP